MNICLIIEEDKYLWTAALHRLHLMEFKWYRTGYPLNDFHFLDGMLKAGAKGLGVNCKDKTVAWTSNPTKHYDYFIEVVK